jgi:hypothetical protein
MSCTRNPGADRLLRWLRGREGNGVDAQRVDHQIAAETRRQTPECERRPQKGEHAVASPMLVQLL